MQRLLVGGTLLLVFGLLFIVRGISGGNGGDVGAGIPGLLVGIGALIFYKVKADEDKESR